MTLPEFLIDDGDGFVHLAGHRIGLHELVRLYTDGSSPEMMAAKFPSVPLALVHRVIAFYLENQPAVDAYVAANDLEIQRQSDAGPKPPSLTELRHRLSRMDAAAAGSE